ncbi:MAG: radical SAM family heme chaperone HemW [Pseudomonadales bacterium]
MTTESTPLHLPPLSLYIHIPWCMRKCPYCDFNSHTTDSIPEKNYVEALIADLDQELESVQGRQLHSIFFGGGTPSLFSAKAINTILSEVEKRIPFSSQIEITLEVNPSTVEQQKFSGYYSAGVNRLSIGVQSFNPHQLKSLGRTHNNVEAINAVQTAKTAGFHNVNIDLMHGLPEQSQVDALQDIQQAVDLDASHISWYQLTIEPNTVFYTSPPTLPVDDLLADIQQAGEQMLAKNNFKQYEISAFCQPNRQSKHNLNYWLFGDYIGIGAGAHGKITSLSNQTIQRRWKTRAPKDYLSTDNNILAGNKEISQEDLPLEFMMNSLRLNAGFQKELFSQRTGLSFSMAEEKIHTLIDRKLLAEHSSTIKPTPIGRKFLNNILAEF